MGPCKDLDAPSSRDGVEEERTPHRSIKDISLWPFDRTSTSLIGLKGRKDL